MTGPLVLGDAPLTLDQLDARLDAPLTVVLAPAGLQRAARGREWVTRLLDQGGAVYGINTGFGHLRNIRIPPAQLDTLQENLLISHAVGVGPPAPPHIVRLMLLIKIHMLLAGHSGVRAELIERLALWLCNDWLPLGASGDLAPLAHLVLPLIGRGQMSVSLAAARQIRDAREVHAAAGLEPLRLVAKEGLALINGTQFMAAYAADIAIRAARLLDAVDVIYCMTLESLRGSLTPADPRLLAVRPHPGAIRVGENIRRLMRGSEILESHRNCDRVQDPYSLRCAPQVHGAIRDALTHFRDVVQRELNAVTDNPILFENAAPDAGIAALSGGNFHGEPLALVLDYLAIALTDLANISERRTYLLLEGHDGLPKLLLRDTGVNSGFMLPQYTAAALVNECKVLATPASIDSIPTSLGQEDHVSMGATSAVKCHEILDRVETVLSIEMLCAAQALDFRAPLRAGVGPQAAHEIVRKDISHAESDREYGQDMRAALAILRDGRLRAALIA
jgi:histidine ammonia-lyase